MITGNINLNIISDDLTNLCFTDYFACYTQTPETKKYFVPANSSIWQMFDEESPHWAHNLANQLPQDFTHHVVSVINIPPGQTIPLHQDKHYILKKKYGDKDTYRYLVMLEDWKSGHYFEIYGKPWLNWKAGDWIKFHQKEWHIAANVGVEPFYSAQVTVS